MTRINYLLTICREKNTSKDKLKSGSNTYLAGRENLDRGYRDETKTFLHVSFNIVWTFETYKYFTC